MYWYSVSRFRSWLVLADVNRTAAPYYSEYSRTCFWMKSRFSSRNFDFSPDAYSKSILLQTTNMGIPKLTLSTPGGSGISTLTSSTSESSEPSSSPCSRFFSSFLPFRISFPCSSIWGSSYVLTCVMIFYFILSNLPASICGNILNRHFDSAAIHAFNCSMISPGFSRSNTMTAVVRSSSFGLMTSWSKSLFSLSYKLQIFILGRLSSDVTTWVKFSESVRSLT